MANYVYVNLGGLDKINGPARYPFPNAAAAEKFARVHKIRDPHRNVRVEYSDGTTRTY